MAATYSKNQATFVRHKDIVLDEDITVALKHYGSRYNKFLNNDNTVYIYLDGYWAANHNPPTIKQICMSTGLKYQAVIHSLNNLFVQKRVKKINRGVWIPVVD